MSFHDQHIKIQTQLHIFDSSTNSFSCWCCLRSAGSGWSPLNQSEQLNIWRLEAMLNWAWVWYSSSNMALFLEQIHDGQPWYWSLIRERQDMTRSYLCIWLMSSDAGDMSHNVQSAAASHISLISCMLCAYSNNKILFLLLSDLHRFTLLKTSLPFTRVYRVWNYWFFHVLGCWKFMPKEPRSELTEI